MIRHVSRSRSLVDGYPGRAVRRSARTLRRRCATREVRVGLRARRRRSAASSGPARTAAALLVAIERIWAGADDLDVPLLGLHGTDDVATDPRGTAELDRRVKNKDHTLLLYRGVRHDLLHEPEKEQIMQDLEKWLVAHAP
ncbi:MAG: serine aminopeptidase domain-containing protein [Polyangiales bacterium]